MKTYLVRIVIPFVVVALSGCSQFTVRSDTGTGSPVERRAHQFALGFYGETEVDLKRECPHGVASFGNKLTAEDVLYSVASVGIYTPRTVVFECAAAPRG